MPPSRAVGIDLGTTRAALARIDEPARSAMIRDAQGDLLIPSVVFFEDDELVCGRAAKLAAVARPDRAAEFFKRDLGQAAYSRAIGGELLSAELIEACLLKKLEAELADQGIAKPAVALSMPASFNQAQRRARLDAAKIARVELLGTINDPLAAALSYAESQGYLHPSTPDKPGCRVLVFDLGGGKLDVAIVEIKPGRLRTMAVGGNAKLGGRDWDLRLAEHLAEQFAKEFGQDPRHDMTSVRRLLESAEEAKQSLSARQQARVQVERGKSAAAIVVTRQAFEEMTADLLDEAAAITEGIVARAGMAWRDVSGLLLVGAATRMPIVAKRLEELTGLVPAAAVHADEAVARGAALYAECLLAAREGRQTDLHVAITDLTVHSLGLEWNDPRTGRVENVVLIARGSELPCGTVAAATTDTAGQSSLVIQLLEGESRAADQCARIALLTVRDLPDGLPKGTQIDVHYQFTAEGRLQVRARLPRSGQSLPISVRREQGLTESQISDWQQLIARGQGLRAIHALLPEHRRQREALAAAQPPGPRAASSAGPPALPNETPADEEFTLETGSDATARRLKKRRMTPRRLAIMLGGYVVSALVGTAIGYYILMRIDPSYNWWHLRLPGLRDAPASSADVH
ncbi:MAG: Hsp70 family protein [Pirellulales bacterium]